MKEALTPEEEISFSSFRDKTKQALEDKLRNHPTIKAKANELDRLRDIKDAFAKIARSKKDEPEIPEITPTVPEVPVEPAI